MIDHVVFDLEVQTDPATLPGGWNDKAAMKVAVAVVYEHRRDHFRIYGPGDIQPLKERLLKADRVTTFNGEGFDFPVTWGMNWIGAREQILPKSDDILARVWDALGSRQKGWKAGEVGLCTLGRGKTGDGSEAPGMFQRGEWCKLIEYCIADVAMERDLGKFLDAYGYLVGGRGPDRLEIPPWKPKETT